jgi:CBS domain-containing protein
MTTSSSVKTFPRVVLQARTAEDLMTTSPVSIAADASVKEAAAFLTDKAFGAAPVIDEAGRPIGVVSQSDLVIHDRERLEYVVAGVEQHARSDGLETQDLPTGFGVVDVDRTQVRDVMTPVIYSVGPDTPAHKVIEDMLGHRVHRLFVVGADGVLVGVISTVDIVRRLRVE